MEAGVDVLGPCLLCSAGARICAIPLTHVEETMRPLPTRPVANAPLFVRGLTLLRGVPAPVLDASALLGAPPEDATRFVSLRVGDRRAALAVAAVLGVRRLDDHGIEALPPLLRVDGSAIEALGALDSALLVVLESSRIVPPEVWAAIDAVAADA